MKGRLGDRGYRQQDLMDPLVDGGLGKPFDVGDVRCEAVGGRGGVLAAAGAAPDPDGILEIAGLGAREPEWAEESDGSNGRPRVEPSGVDVRREIEEGGVDARGIVGDRSKPSCGKRGKVEE